MGLALRVLPVATIFQMRRGEHNNVRNRGWIPISQVDERRGAVLSGEMCYMFGVRCTTEVAQGQTQQMRMMFDRCMCCCCWL